MTNQTNHAKILNQARANLGDRPYYNSVEFFEEVARLQAVETSTFPIPPTRRLFVPVLGLGRNVEVEVLRWEYCDGVSYTVVRSIDAVQPEPFYRPGTLYQTAYATVPTSSIIVTMEQGTGPVIDMAEETDAERRDDADCIRYAGAPN